MRCVFVCVSSDSDVYDCVSSICVFRLNLSGWRFSQYELVLKVTYT